MAIILEGGSLAEADWNGTRVEIPSAFYMPDTPAFHAYRDAGHVAAGSQIVFNGTRLNRGNHFNTSTGVFTAPIAGPYWFFFWGMDTNSGVTYNNMYVAMRRNSSTSDELRIYTSTNSTVRTQVSGGQVFRLAAGDTMEVDNVTRTSMYGTSYVYCYFAGCFLG